MPRTEDVLTIGANAVDTLYSAGGNTDTIVNTLQVVEPAVPAAAEDVFGNMSVLADGMPLVDFPATLGTFLTGTPLYSILVLLCFCAYCIIIYNYRSQILTLVNIFRGRLYVERILQEQNFTFEMFLRVLIFLGMALVGIVVVKFSDMRIGGDAASFLPYWGIFILPVVVWGVMALMWGYRTVSLNIAGWLTMSTRFTSDIKHLRKLIAGVSSLLLAPVMMLYALADEKAAGVILIVLVSETAVFFIFLLFRTYMLFMQQKVSILYWFLYLCAVEILPVSFLVLLVLKNL